MNNCLIVDDEKPARELIRSYLEVLPNFNVVASFDNAIEAFSFLQNNTVDLLFLDIQMPKITGLELVKTLKNRPKVIFTTAYREFAVEAFEEEVFDYLVKPISQERFLKTIDKYLLFERNSEKLPESTNPFKEAYIFLKVDKEQKKIFLKDILFVEGLKDYVKLYTSTEMVVVYERLGFMELKLPDTNFIRVHKSFIVAIEKVESFSNAHIKIDNNEIPIGRMYKQAFTERMSSFIS